ncbi:MAG TPA: ATP-binding protein [Woeseiaceae bacterium]|nr:ATP-binding protein [Woeseiaceae bacterium]
MHSLSARLLASVSFLLLVFFGATIVLLDTAFRDAGEQAQRNILESQLMSLLAAAEPNGAGELEMPPDLPEERFASPGSGLYAALRDSRGNTVWRSRSSLGLELPYPEPAVQGEQRYAVINSPAGGELMVLSLAVAWELPSGALEPYTFSVAESLDTYHAQIAAFQKQLFGWFAAVAIVIVFAISLVMRGILKPLRQIEKEIGEIEEGRRQFLSEAFPSELRGVALNMNVLIGTERARSERYMHTLGNLAHSLKTPLAAIRSVLSEHPETDPREKIEHQVERMNDIVRYQLRKPARYASEGFGVASVAIGKELERLADALAKVYKDKEPRIGIEVADGVIFRGDSGDFLELAGNLLDNACKWCRKEVTIRVQPAASKGTGFEMTVTDDGPGIPEAAAERLLERGMRLDESAPGHGIGLAVVREIVTSYGGTVDIGRSAPGGARITVRIAL